MKPRAVSDELLLLESRRLVQDTMGQLIAAGRSPEEAWLIFELAAGSAKEAIEYAATTCEPESERTAAMVLYQSATERLPRLKGLSKKRHVETADSCDEIYRKLGKPQRVQS